MLWPAISEAQGDGGDGGDGALMEGGHGSRGDGGCLFLGVPGYTPGLVQKNQHCVK